MKSPVSFVQAKKAGMTDLSRNIQNFVDKVRGHCLLSVHLSLVRSSANLQNCQIYDIPAASKLPVLLHNIVMRKSKVNVCMCSILRKHISKYQKLLSLKDPDEQLFHDKY